MPLKRTLRPCQNDPGFRWWALLTVAMGALIVHFYGHVLVAPDSVLFSGDGDGLKNYFTLLWHAEHDRSFLHYTGSGHPYGEHVFYTDGHPLLGWVLQLAPALAPHAVGILNLSLILGLAACAWCLFAVLRRLEVAPWAAAIGAFSITVLQPQIFRMGGHFSLAHAWMIPLSILMLLRTRASGHWPRRSVSAGLVLLICFLTHPYMGLMNALLLLGYYACLLLFRGRGLWKQRRTYLEPLVMAVLPMLLFLVLLGWGDAVTDRPSAPHGADKYATRLMSLIVPTHGPFATSLQEFFKYDALEWETWCYLGLGSLLIPIVAGGVQLRRWATRGAHAPLDDAGILLGAGFLVLLFAMGVWQDWFGEWLPMLAQFRGAGRFAWVFYFACAVFCTTRLYHWLFTGEAVRKWVAAAIYMAVIGSYAWEGWAHHREESASIGHVPSPFKATALNDRSAALIEAVRASGASAIIPLPYQHVGSEHYQKDAPEGMLASVLPIAYHSGVPLMAGITSRTSLQHTRDLLALRAPDYFRKNLAAVLPRDARFILLRTGDPLEPDEQALWEKGKGVPGEDRLRSIDASALFAYDGNARLAHYNAMKDHLPSRGGWRIDAPSGDTASMRRFHFKTDSVQGRVGDYTTLIEVAPGELDTAITYEFSFIFHAIDPAAINVSLVLEHVRADGGDMHWGALRNVRSMPMQYPGRTIATLTFKPTGMDRSHKLFLKGPDDMEDHFRASHILLRPAGLDAWREGAWEERPAVFLNNVPITSGAPAP